MAARSGVVSDGRRDLDVKNEENMEMRSSSAAAEAEDCVGETGWSGTRFHDGLGNEAPEDRESALAHFRATSLLHRLALGRHAACRRRGIMRKGKTRPLSLLVHAPQTTAQPMGDAMERMQPGPASIDGAKRNVMNAM